MPRSSVRSPSVQAKRRAELAKVLLQRIRHRPWQSARELLAWVNQGRRRSLCGGDLVGPLRLLRGLNTRGDPDGAPRVQVSGQRSAARYAAIGCKKPAPPRFAAPVR